MICPEPSELQELVRQLHRQASPWLPAGQASRLHWGPPVQAAPGEQQPLVVSTRRLDRVIEHCVGDGGLEQRKRFFEIVECVHQYDSRQNG